MVHPLLNLVHVIKLALELAVRQLIVHGYIVQQLWAKRGHCMWAQLQLEDHVMLNHEARELGALARVLLAHGPLAHLDPVRVHVLGRRAALQQLGLVDCKVGDLCHAHVNASVGLALPLLQHKHRVLPLYGGVLACVGINLPFQRRYLLGRIGAVRLLPVPTHHAVIQLVLDRHGGGHLVLSREGGGGRKRRGGRAQSAASGAPS